MTDRRSSTNHRQRYQPRREFLRSSSGILAATALSMLSRDGATLSAGEPSLDGRHGGASVRKLHFAPKAKNVIFLFMSGGPSHVDLLDPKPELLLREGQAIPKSIIRDVHFAQISRQTRAPLCKGSPYLFRPNAASGTQVSDLLPHTRQIADRIAVIRSIRSEVFNHDPAVLLMNTGDSRFGRPSMGSWLSWGMGSDNRDLPSFVVLASGVKIQPLLDSYWGAGFLPAEHQGVTFRTSGDPVLFVSSPAGIDRAKRRRQLDLLSDLNSERLDLVGDPEIAARMRQYELAYGMQRSVPELTDIATEPESIRDLYGAKPGEVSFANNCLLSRRLVERGVRFVQLYHMGWDAHRDCAGNHAKQCRAVDQASAALIRDLESRGLLESTLVIWGGEFGRTPVVEGALDAKWGRDHHPHGFSMWMAGGGIRPGVTHGGTDDFGFHAVNKTVSIHDVHATALRLLGFDHHDLTFRSQGRDFRLTDEFGSVIDDLIA